MSFVTKDAGLALAAGRLGCRISVVEGFCWALSVQWHGHTWVPRGSGRVISRDIPRSPPQWWAPRTSPHLHENCKVTQRSQARPSCYSLVKTCTSNSSREEGMWIWPFSDVHSPHTKVFKTPWSKCSPPILFVHFFTLQIVLSAYCGRKGSRECVTICNSGLGRPP